MYIEQPVFFFYFHLLEPMAVLGFTIMFIVLTLTLRVMIKYGISGLSTVIHGNNLQWFYD